MNTLALGESMNAARGGEKEWEGCVGGGGGSRLGVCGCVVRVACCRQLPAASRSPASQAFAAVGCA